MWSSTLSEQGYIHTVWTVCSPSVVLACVCMHTHMHCIYATEYMTVYEEFISIYPSLWGRGFAGFYYWQLLYNTSYPSLCSPKRLWRVYSVWDWWHQTPSAKILQRRLVLDQWLQGWWQLSWTISSTLRVITYNLTGGVILSRLQTLQLMSTNKYWHTMQYSWCTWWRCYGC